MNRDKSLLATMKLKYRRENVMNDLITVFTPTYNRGYILENLFSSLIKQTNKNFEWIIVDDGSTDNTESVVNSFIEKSDFNIRYIKKINEGKHIAINLGAELANGVWFFIVDSDDYLRENAIEKINYYVKQVRDDFSFAGVAGLRGNKSGKVWENYYNSKISTNSKWLEKEYIDATCIEYRFKMNISGDRAEVIRTELLRKFKFPNIDGEKFVSEGYLWLNLANCNYKFRWFNNVIYITEYIEDGLSQNINNIYKKNWKSACLINNFCLNFKDIPLSVRVKKCINYFRYGIYGKRSILGLYKQCEMKLISVPCMIIAILKKIK